MDLAGAPTPALLLARVVYWDKHTKIVEDGVRWTGKSKEEWVLDAGLTSRKYDRAVAILKDADLITAKQMYWGTRKKVFLGLTPWVKDAIKAVGHGNLVPRHLAKNGNLVPKHLAKNGNYIRYGRLRKILEIKNCSLPLAAPNSETSMKPHGKSVAQLLADGGSGVVTTHKPDSIAALEAAWRKGVLGFVPPLTLQARGQLKHFIKACPPGTAEAIVEHVVSDWVGFTSAAKTDAAAFNIPTKPQLGFMLKFAGVAIAMHSKKNEVKVSPVPKKKIVQLTAIEEAPVSDKATLKEMLKILGN